MCLDLVLTRTDELHPPANECSRSGRTATVQTKQKQPLALSQAGAKCLTDMYDGHDVLWNIQTIIYFIFYRDRVLMSIKMDVGEIWNPTQR